MKHLLISFFTLLCSTLFSQKVLIPNNSGWCGTPNTYSGATSHDPPPSSPTNESLVDPDGIIIIPVVFHIVLDNSRMGSFLDSRITSQLERLNTDFRKLNSDIASVPSVWGLLPADIKIEFRLACVDPNGNPTTGITRTTTTVTEFMDSWKVKRTSEGGYDAWPTNKYLNIWVCNYAPLANILGDATIPEAYSSTSSGGGYPGYLLDGITLDYEVVGDNNGHLTKDKGRVAVHEAGHWLGLRHPYTSVNCDDVVWGDNITDTPTQLDGSFNLCPSFPTTDFCSAVFPGIMFMNYMDATNDPCRYMFTLGQKDRMRSYIAVPGSIRFPFLKNYFGLMTGNAQSPVCNQRVISISNPMCLTFSASISGNGAIVNTTSTTVTVETPIGVVNGSFTLTLTTSDNYFSQETYYFSIAPSANVTITAIGLEEMCQPPNTQQCIPLWTGDAIITYQVPAIYSQYLWEAVEGTILSGQGTNSIIVQHSYSGPPPSYHGARIWVNGGACFAEVSYIGCIGCDPEQPREKELLSIKIYPNPVISDFRLQLNNGKNISKVIIKDIYGNVVLTKSLNNDVKEVNYNLTGVKPGVYYVQIFDGNKWIAGKFIKQ